ncbi:hypothetical protein [Alkaliphilus serpentinus]|uniref:AMP-activated protein kinase glycogen-binding domain-containing protein n=1 Tax=Alkaliphilus serpentinus TaxID=1482731 RepID=A0A833HN77_9FIRM|nr:hypothetical protein [Alkaliphilus serpentinus]KAB3529254.1 hypothetical protein F8153_09610 [Alkaliphilus serpentinus]
MKHTIYYDPQDYISINKISLIGDFNNWNSGLNFLQKNEKGVWSTEIDLQPGEYRYKFLINNLIPLNDPLANLYLPKDDGELASVIIINSEGEKLINTEKYTVNIEKYHLSDEVHESTPKVHKRIFQQTTKRVVSRFEFTNVTGIHTISLLWFRPNGDFHYSSENILYTSEKEASKPTVMWFWLNLIGYEVPSGIWTLKLFIDGAFILQDSFTITTNTYSKMDQKFKISQTGAITDVVI